MKTYEIDIHGFWCGDSLEIMKKWENMTNDIKMH